MQQTFESARNITGWSVAGMFRRKKQAFTASVFEADHKSESQRFRRLTFTFAVISLAARLSAADGPVSTQEFAAFRHIFPLVDDSETTLKRLFDDAVNESGSAMRYARQIERLFPKKPKLREEVLCRLIRIAAIDGPISVEEQQFLAQVCDALNLPRSFFKRQVRPFRRINVNDPYAVLGLKAKVSEPTLRTRYRQLIREYHPDGLAAFGYSTAEVERYAAKLASINAAYTTICAKRGLSK